MDLNEFRDKLGAAIGIEPDLIEHKPGGVTDITKSCPFCKKRSTMRVRTRNYRLWMAGAHVQDVWPDHSPGWREWMTSGCHEECFDEGMPS